MIAGIGCAFVGDLAGVDRIAQQKVELTATEKAIPVGTAIGSDALRGTQALGFEPIGKLTDIAQFEIARINRAHEHSVILDNRQAAPIGPIAERRHAAHPHALGLGSCDLVADALGGHFAFELSKGEQHVEG